MKSVVCLLQLCATYAVAFDEDVNMDLSFGNQEGSTEKSSMWSDTPSFRGANVKSRLLQIAAPVPDSPLELTSEVFRLQVCESTLLKVVSRIDASNARRISGSVAPVCEDIARELLRKDLLASDRIQEQDQRGISELCFKLDGRLSMALESTAATVNSAMSEAAWDPFVQESRAQFCERFSNGVMPKRLPRRRTSPTSPRKIASTQTSPETASQLEAVEQLVRMPGFQRVCLVTSSAMQSEVIDSVQRLFTEAARTKILAFNSHDQQVLKQCTEEIHELGTSPLTAQQVCSDMSQSFLSLKGASKDLKPSAFCGIYARQFAPTETTREAVAQLVPSSPQPPTSTLPKVETATGSIDADQLSEKIVSEITGADKNQTLNTEQMAKKLEDAVWKQGSSLWIS